MKNLLLPFVIVLFCSFKSSDINKNLSPDEAQAMMDSVKYFSIKEQKKVIMNCVARYSYYSLETGEKNL